MRALVVTVLVLAGCLGAPAPAEPDAGSAAAAPEGDPRPVSTPPGGTVRGPPAPVGVQFPLGRYAGEPTIGVAQDGSVFVSAGTDVLRSRDSGRTWESVGPLLPGGVELPAGSTEPGNSNDNFLHVDPSTGRVFSVQLQGLVCSYWLWSDDGGDSWERNPAGCGLPVNDHPTVFTGVPVASSTKDYPNVVYYCWNGYTGTFCSKSLDGGRTFLPTGRPAQLAARPDPDAPECGGLTGHGLAGPDGAIYLGKGGCGKVFVLASRDEGATWEENVVPSPTPPVDHDVELAVDAAGTLYAVFLAEDWLPYLSSSKDGGRTWTEPSGVAAPGVTSTFFPVVDAGGPGRVVVAYVGVEGERGPPDDQPSDARWSLHIAVVGGADTAFPEIKTTRTSGDDAPVHVGPCAGRCGAFLDFHDVAVGADGRPLVASQSCLDQCDEAPLVPFVVTRVGGGILGTLAAGPSLLDGSPLPPIP